MNLLPLFAPPAATDPEDLSPIVASNGRTLRPTVAFRSYWYFASERQAMLYRRLRGDPVLTRDPILQSYRFTNAYRAADRVTQFVINDVIPNSDSSVHDLVFRVLLFKVFNKIETWRALELELGEPISWCSFSIARFERAFSRLKETGRPLYSNAYIMPNPPFGHRAKYLNHLELLQWAIKGGLAERLERARTLRELYESLRAVPSFGAFLAFQYAVDLNYAACWCFDEMEFVVPGPGATEGMQRCFQGFADYSQTDMIRIMADLADASFARFGLSFNSLWGRRLQLIDCQNVFCEVGKYARLAHPELVVDGQRKRIKQRYGLAGMALPKLTFPAAWNISSEKVPHGVSRLRE
jgi:hypothetical protein